MQKVTRNLKGYYQTKSKDKRRKFFNLFIVSFLFSFLLSMIINLYFFRIYKLKVLPEESTHHYYIVNLFNKNFKLYEEILINHPYEEKVKLPAKILGMPNDIIKVQNDKIEINSKILFLRNPLPLIFEKKESFIIKENEYYVISENSIDSFEIGTIRKEEIIGKIIYKF